MDVDAFWNSFDRSGGPDSCWPWTKARNKEGYGGVKISGVFVYTHVLAFETHHRRRVKPGQLVRHSCNNPPCGNPAHLKEGTHTDNLNDQYYAGRRRRRERATRG